MSEFHSRHSIAGWSFRAMLAILLAGCVGQVDYGKTEDLFRSVDTSQKASLMRARLALVTTENSARSFQHMADVKRLGDGFMGAGATAELDPQKAADDLLRVFRGKFTDVIKVNSVADAATAGADLVMVMDLKIQIAQIAFKDHVIEFAGQLRSPSGAVIDQINALGKSTVPFPAFNINFASGWKMALNDLENKLNGSTKLREFVAAIPAQPQVSTGVAAAPAAVDIAFWDSVKSSNNPADLQAYLQKFPNGSFVTLARSRLSSLGELAPVRLAPIGIAGDQKFNFGNYHALVIGNNNYRSVTPLQTAVADAKTVGDLLRSEYGFNVTLLLDATRNQMLDAFDELRRKLNENDNLLVYYAGHGFLDTDSDRGFWLPVDADVDRRANWLSNSDLADFARASRAKHILVVADSCYAGTLTRSVSLQMSALDDIARLSQKRARTALVSGGLEPVSDAGGGEHSVFAKAFVDVLLSNTGIVDMSQVFSSMRRQVILNAEQTPQYGDIRQTGHEGGDFIFVRRK